MGCWVRGVQSLGAACCQSGVLPLGSVVTTGLQTMVAWNEGPAGYVCGPGAILCASILFPFTPDMTSPGAEGINFLCR